MSAVTTHSRPARIALLGCGTIGREVARRLLDPPTARPGLALIKVLVRDCARDRGLPPEVFTDRFEDVLDEEPDVVVELLGGLDPAARCVERALSLGIPVATANKTLIAHHGADLAAVGERHGAGLAFEASVCAGLPVLGALEQLRGDRVRSIRAIVSGSCNFILGRLALGVAFERALAEARQRGLVEPDPSADISGRDSAEKVCVLGAAAGYAVRPEQVTREGIDRLAPEDFRAARESGRVIKLIAELDLGDRARFRVGPTLVPRGHPLAAVAGEENAVLVDAELAGELFFKGKGAGPGPTASAVLGDVLRLLSGARLCASGARPVRSPGDGARREHVVRVLRSGADPSPEHLLGVLRERGAAVRQVELSRAGTHVLSRGRTEAEALGDGAAVAGGDTGRVLVMPVLEADRGGGGR